MYYYSVTKWSNDGQSKINSQMCWDKKKTRRKQNISFWKNSNGFISSENIVTFEDIKL